MISNQKLDVRVRVVSGEVAALHERVERVERERVERERVERERVERERVERERVEGERVERERVEREVRVEEVCMWVQRRVGGVEEKCEKIGGVGD